MKEFFQFKASLIDFSSKSIEFAPAGKHTVKAHIRKDGKLVPAEISMTINESVIEILNANLDARIASSKAGNSSRPFIDFDHEGKTAAAIPKKFFWNNGIRLEVEWTVAGQEAIEGRNYSYFSPEMLINPKTGEIIGLPNLGSIGSLVNTPAFQNIEQLAAARSTNKPTPNKMDIETLKVQLSAAEAKLSASLSEVATLTASAAKVVIERDSLTVERDVLVVERDELNEKVTTLTASASILRKEKIEAAIEAKGIKEESRPVILAACLQSDDDGEALIAAYEAQKPTGHKPVDKTIKKDAEATGVNRLEAAFKAQSQAK
jgi:phage I-like protein